MRRRHYCARFCADHQQQLETLPCVRVGHLLERRQSSASGVCVATKTPALQGRETSPLPPSHAPRAAHGSRRRRSSPDNNNKNLQAPAHWEPLTTRAVARHCHQRHRHSKTQLTLTARDATVATGRRTASDTCAAHSNEAALELAAGVHTKVDAAQSLADGSRRRAPAARSIARRWRQTQTLVLLPPISSTSLVVVGA
jgi:hypothetical protein